MTVPGRINWWAVPVVAAAVVLMVIGAPIGLLAALAAWPLEGWYRRRCLRRLLEGKEHVCRTAVTDKASGR